MQLYYLWDSLWWGHAGTSVAAAKELHSSVIDLMGNKHLRQVSGRKTHP